MLIIYRDHPITQDVPERGTENWRVSFMAQKNENNLHIHGSENALVIN
jgi:hypothetical protein